jgi:hypothetical protein
LRRCARTRPEAEAATGWTDDMFMAPVVLVRGGPKGIAAAGGLLL